MHKFNATRGQGRLCSRGGNWVSLVSIFQRGKEEEEKMLFYLDVSQISVGESLLAEKGGSFSHNPGFKERKEETH